MLKIRAALDSSFRGKHDDGRTVYKGVATSLALDRYREVVVPKGGDFENFYANPVLMKQHDFSDLPIGSVLSLDVQPDKIEFTFVFDEEDDEAVRVQKKMENGTMNSFSIGFLPRNWVYGSQFTDKKGDMPAEIEVVLGSGEKQTLNTEGWEQTPWLLYTDWELLEISPVSIPANPDAVLMQMSKELLAAAANPTVKHFMEADLADALKGLQEEVQTFAKTFGENYQLPNGISGHSAPACDEDFDADIALGQIAKYATDKVTEVMDFAKFSKGFALMDAENPEKLISYKYLHHVVVDGTLMTSVKGLYSAMSALLGAKSEKDVVEDAKAVYDHLARHYGDLEIEAPSFDGEYTKDDLTQIKEGTYATASPATEEDGKTASPVLTASENHTEVTSRLESVEERIAGLTIKVGSVLEALMALEEKKAKEQVDPPAVDPVEKLDAGLVTELKSFMEERRQSAK